MIFPLKPPFSSGILHGYVKKTDGTINIYKHLWWSVLKHFKDDVLDAANFTGNLQIIHEQYPSMDDVFHETKKTSMNIHEQYPWTIPDWWFGTFSIFPYIRKFIIPIDSYSGVLKPPTMVQWNCNIQTIIQWPGCGGPLGVPPVPPVVLPVAPLRPPNLIQQQAEAPGFCSTKTWGWINTNYHQKWVGEHPHKDYSIHFWDVHQGYLVLTHSHIEKPSNNLD